MRPMTLALVVVLTVAAISRADSTTGWQVPRPPVPAVTEQGGHLPRYLRLESPIEVPRSDTVRGAQWIVDGAAQPMVTQGDGRFFVDWNVPSDRTKVSVSLRLETDSGAVNGPAAEVELLPKAAVMDWGATASACVLAESCRPMPPLGSALPVGTRWAARRALETPEGDLRVSIRDGSGNMTEIGGEPRVLGSVAGAMICLSPDACSTLSAEIDMKERLILGIMTDDGQSVGGDALSVPLAAHVIPAGWMACWGRTLIELLALALVMLLLYGFIRPKKFPRQSGMGSYPWGVAVAPYAGRARPARTSAIAPNAVGGFWWTDHGAYFNDSMMPTRNRRAAILRLEIVRRAPKGSTAVVSSPTAWISASGSLLRSKESFRAGATEYRWERVPPEGEPVQTGRVYVVNRGSVFIFE